MSDGELLQCPSIMWQLHFMQSDYYIIAHTFQPAETHTLLNCVTIKSNRINESFTLQCSVMIMSQLFCSTRQEAAYTDSSRSTAQTWRLGMTCILFIWTKSVRVAVWIRSHWLSITGITQKTFDTCAAVLNKGSWFGGRWGRCRLCSEPGDEASRVQQLNDMQVWVIAKTFEGGTSSFDVLWY